MRAGDTVCGAGYHSISVKHAHRNASQYEGLANTGRLSDGERFVALVKRTVGKRLTYAERVGA